MRERRDRLHYEVHNGRGPHCLFVHGYLSSRAQWLPNLEALAGYIRPIVVELYGHGRSPTPQNASEYAPDAYVEQFEHIRAQLGVERWFVCGQSLGAALTLRYALDHPQRVMAQVFTNSMSALASAGWSERVRPAMAAQARMFETAGRSAVDTHPLNPLRSRRLPPDLRLAFESDLRLHDPAGLARTGLYTVPESPVRTRITENSVPSLLVAGDCELRFAEQRAFAERSMPLLRVARVDAGHAANVDAAEAFNAAVAEFLTEHGGMVRLENEDV
jgi:2-succinyl-6-hydroxy-2,4-cyclohexadiene-1-carboxylate synthase